MSPCDRVGVDRVRRVVGFGHQREHRAHAFGAGERALQLPGRVRDRRQRTVDRAEIADHDRQLADRQPPVHHLHPADDDDERRAEDGDRRDDDGEQRALPGDRNPRVHRRFAGGGVAAQFVRFAREALHEPDRAERFVQPRQQVRFELLDALLAVDERRHVVAEAQEEERHDRQRQQRDRHVHPQQHAEHHDQRRHRSGERKQSAHDQVLDRVGVDVDAVDRVGRCWS